ncbi:MAG: hypothetical protein RL318_1713 [Fibrobacterota bacterium]|jgi:hypothetical protein
MDNADRLLARLRQENIRPIPRRVVLLHRAGRAALLGLCVLASAVSIALVFQELFPKGGRGWHFRLALSQAAPWIWGLSAIVLAWAGIRLFRSLPRGWRVRPLPLATGFASLSLVLATLLFQTDAFLSMHRFVAHRFPFYRAAWQQHVGEMKSDCEKNGEVRKDSAGCDRNHR